MYPNYQYYNPNQNGNSYQNFQQMPQQNLPQFALKGRPVTSFEEARAAQIDLDGSLFIFPDLSNKRIYTKQLGLDGTAPLKVYELVETQEISMNDYVTRKELDEVSNQLTSLIEEMRKPAVTLDQGKPAQVLF